MLPKPHKASTRRGSAAHSIAVVVGPELHSHFVPLAVVSRRSKTMRQRAAHSITSSAVASSVGGTSRSSILAVSTLMISSNLDAYTTDTRRQDWPPKSVAIATAATHSRS